MGFVAVIREVEKIVADADRASELEKDVARLRGLLSEALPGLRDAWRFGYGVNTRLVERIEKELRTGT